jgi:1,2-dihydroxy-3-keto-5-methylthiopentene dioxygenase
MAIVRRHEDGTTWTDADAIRELLAGHGVVYEQWDISRLAATPKADGESDQDHVLRVFGDEVKRISEQRGYRAADVISLWPDTPNLDALLAKFDREHIHTEDEVRFVVRGRGIFAIRGADSRMYDVEVHPGDLLAVPEGTQHWFTLCEDRQIQCIRLFTDTAGWVAHYVEASA